MCHVRSIADRALLPRRLETWRWRRPRARILYFPYTTRLVYHILRPVYYMMLMYVYVYTYMRKRICMRSRLATCERGSQPGGEGDPARSAQPPALPPPAPLPPLALTVLYLALTVLYLALTVLYMALTVIYRALTVLYSVELGLIGTWRWRRSRAILPASSTAASRPAAASSRANPLGKSTLFCANPSSGVPRS